MKLQVIKNVFLKGVMWFSIATILLFLTFTSLLRLPPIQTRLIQSVTEDLKAYTGFDFQIGYLNFNWFDELVVKDLRVKDHSDSTMIMVPELILNVSITSILNKKHRKVDKVSIHHGTVALYKHLPDEPINITSFVDTIKYYVSGDGKAKFSIKKIELDNSNLKFQNFTTNETYPGFDINKFTLSELGGSARDFLIRSDTVTFFMEGLHAVENKTLLKIHSLTSDYIVHQRSMGFRALDLRIGDSHIGDSIVFSFDTLSNLTYFIDSVSMNIRLRNSEIHTSDLKFFSKEFRNIKDVFYLSGEYLGNVPDFGVKDMDLRLADGSRLKGDMVFSGLPNLEETFIGIRMSDASLSTMELGKYLSQDVMKKIPGIEYFNFSGNFTGFLNDFVAYGELNTNLGELITDLNIKIKSEATYYEGNITTRDFDFGTFAKIPLFRKMDMQGSIIGSGLTVADADFKLDGQIFRLEINEYPVTNIETNARFASEFFEGELKINDPNLRLAATGSIDLRENKNLFNIKANLDTIVFHELNLINRVATISTTIDVDASGLEIDSIKGTLSLRNFKALYDTNRLTIDRLNLKSDFGQTSRSMTLQTERINAGIEGNFAYSQFFGDLKTLLKEYRLNLQNNEDSLKAYYSAKQVDGDSAAPYRLEYFFDLKNINPIIQLFNPGIKLSKDLVADGSFYKGYTSIFSFHTEFDSLQVGKEIFLDNLVEINASKISDSTNVLAVIFVNSQSQKFSSNTRTQNLIAEAVWDRNVIDFNLAVRQENLESYADVYGEVLFTPDLTVIKLKPSDLQALNEKWVIQPDNQITLSGPEIHFANMGLNNKDQSLLIEGAFSNNPDTSLILSVNKVELSNLDPLTSRKLRGSSDGFLRLSNVYNDLRFETNMFINEFMVNDFLVGDVHNKSDWDHVNKRFELLFDVIRNGEQLMNIGGFYKPGEAGGLDMIARLERADLKLAEPFVGEFFSEFQGYIAGDFKVKGSLSDPKFEGSGKLIAGGARINYLKTYYNLEGDVIMRNNEIGFRNVILTDRDGNNARLEGGFFLEGFNRFSIDFFGTFTNFLTLNTTVSDNDLFYGTASGTGDISIRGYPEQLVMEVNATTTPGTRLFIPLSGNSQIDQEDFVRFVAFSDQETEDGEKTEITGKAPLTGLDLTLNIDVTSDAYGELIFDQAVGDIIRGRGTGNLKFRLDPLGEFSLFGDYQFVEGGYNFTLYNIVNKEFTILPESKITWLGDPYGGTLNIKASYSQLASVGPLLDTAYRDAIEVRRRYATRVILDLEGALLSPDISFDIEIEDYPSTFQTDNGTLVNLETELAAVRTEWNLNEQELQKQVFSLIVLRQFSEESLTAGGTVGSSVSEFVSNQLSYWISQVDENLEIDIILGDLSTEAYNTFQLRLSYTFLDGRLRVTRDGGVTNPSNNQADVYSLLGDWSVEYLLTENGNLRVKIFQKTDFNSFDRGFSADYSVLRGGFSLIYTQSFDEVKEILETARESENTDASVGNGPVDSPGGRPAANDQQDALLRNEGNGIDEKEIPKAAKSGKRTKGKNPDGRRSK